MEQMIELALTDIQESYRTLRLLSPSSVRHMETSLRRYGQLSPVVVYEANSNQYELLDGFKRLHAAKKIDEIATLSARVLKVGVRSAKAAVLFLNWASQSVKELEEAFVVRSLIREDGMMQIEVATLLKRGKSWVSRRLALAEKLCEEAQEQIRLGLISPTIGRELTKLPRGNQEEVLEAIRDHQLTTREVSALVEGLSEVGRQEWSRILSNPQKALSHWQKHSVVAHDARLSKRANQMKREVVMMEGACHRIERSISQGTFLTLSEMEQMVLMPEIGKAQRAAEASIRAMKALLIQTSGRERLDE